MVEPIQSQLPIKPDQILEIIIRRKWLLIIPLCIALTIGLYTTFTASKTYQASTFILVQPQRVPTEFVQSVVTSTISQRISTISQQILSRSNLEKIIDQFGLFENMEDVYLEDKVAAMRKRVSVKIEKSRRRQGTEAFSISYKGSDRQRVMRIANTLASYFMDENLKVREAQAVGTSEFLDSELEKTRQRLEEREKRLSEYRIKYLGGLPDELESNLRTLDRLQLQLSDRYNALNDTKTTLALFETELEKKREILAELKVKSDNPSEQPTIPNNEIIKTEDEQKLEVANKEYENLLLLYTPKHPDVMKLKRVIEKLEKSVSEIKEDDKKESEENKPQIKAEQLSTTVKDQTIKPGIAQAELNILQAELKIKQMKSEVIKINDNIAKIEQSMDIYQKRVEDTPKREQELKNLQRDYANIQDIYNSLLSRQLESEISVNMEKKQKGEQFRILDHARLPEKPISPNVKTLFLFSIAAGLGVGIGIVFLLEFFDSSIRHDEQIEKELGLNIIASIPLMKAHENKLRNRIKLSLFFCFVIYALTASSFFAVLNAKGLDRTINYIKMTLNL